MDIQKGGTMDYVEWIGCLLGITTLAQIMGLMNLWIDDFKILAILNIIGTLMIVLSGKRGFKSKYYDFVEMFGFAFMVCVLVVYGMFGDMMEFLQDPQVKYGVLLVCSIVYFAMAKRD